MNGVSITVALKLSKHQQNQPFRIFFFSVFQHNVKDLVKSRKGEGREGNGGRVRLGEHSSMASASGSCSDFYDGSVR